MQLADLDNDGDLDVLVTDQSQRLSYFKGDLTTENFDQFIIDPCIGPTRAHFAVDLDNNGWVDLLVGNNSEDRIARYMRDDDGNWLEPVFLDGFYFNPQSISMGDLNNDGLNDLVVGSGTSNEPLQYALREQNEEQNNRGGRKLFPTFFLGLLRGQKILE